MPCAFDLGVKVLIYAVVVDLAHGAMPRRVVDFEVWTTIYSGPGTEDEVSVVHGNRIRSGGGL